MKPLDWKTYIPAAILVIASVGIAVTFVYIASLRQLTTLENTLFQVFVLAAGIYGSYLIGTKSARRTAWEIVVPHARSSFRRVVSLYLSLSRLAAEIANSQSEDSNLNSHSQATLDKLRVMVTEQIATVGDAVEDWKDIVPNEVEDIVRKIKDASREREDGY